MPPSAPATPRRRRERGSINADEIISGAFEVAADVSMDNLSMPLLAKHLGVGVTSIYWCFRKKDDLLNAMTDRALHEYNFTNPSIDADNWRESLRKHAHTVRQTFRSNPVLCDLVLIRGTYSRGAARNALEKIEQPVAALVRAGLSPEDAFNTYAAIAVDTRGCAVLERLQNVSHGVGAADDANFDYIVDSILDHAERLIALCSTRSTDATGGPT